MSDRISSINGFRLVALGRLPEPKYVRGRVPLCGLCYPVQELLVVPDSASKPRYKLIGFDPLRWNTCNEFRLGEPIDWSCGGWSNSGSKSNSHGRGIKRSVVRYVCVRAIFRQTICLPSVQR